MTFSVSAGSADVQISPDTFDRLYPFNFVIDGAGRIAGLGSSLLRLRCPPTRGLAFEEEFSLGPQQAGLTPAQIAAGDRKLVLMNHRRSALRLRGEFISMTDASILFLGSPWVEDFESIDALGLSLNEFAINDPVVDLINLLEAQRNATSDLRAVNARLVEQRAELRRLNTELSEQAAAARKIASVAAHSESAVIIADSKGHIEWVNAGFEKLTGYALDEVKGRRPGSFLQCPETDPTTVAYMRTCFERQAGFHVEILNAHKSGRRYWLSLEVQPVFDAEGKLVQFTALETDVTERKLAEEQLALQFGVGELIARSTDLRLALNEILPLVASRLAWRSAAIWLRRVGETTVERVAYWGAEGATETLPAESGCGCGRELVDMVLASGSSWVESPRACGGLPTEEAENWHFLPLRSSGTFLGVFAFQAATSGEIETGLRTVIQTIASQLAQFVIRAREAARAQRLAQELNVIFELSPDGFMAFDQQGQLLYANPAFVRLTGVARERYDALELIESKLAAQCDAGYPYKAISASDEDSEDLIVFGGPPQRWLQRRVRRLVGGNETSTAMVIYWRDVTREKEVEHMKSEFLSTAAHELRTPMASIHGFAELLLARKFDEENQRDMLTRIHRQSRLLTQMVNELLDLARIEARAGKDFDMQRHAIQPLLQETVAALHMPDDRREIEVEIAEPLPEVSVDWDKTRQAVTNVLSNAFKYSPQGGAIKLTARQEIEPGVGAWLEVCVSDQGIGMTPEQRAHVFERFWRADTSGRIPGTGLGLCLVKEIIEIQGGKVLVGKSLWRGHERAHPIAGFVLKRSSAIATPSGCCAS